MRTGGITISIVQANAYSLKQEPRTKGDVLLHDNAGPHTAAFTTKMLQKLNFELLVSLSSI